MSEICVLPKRGRPQSTQPVPDDFAHFAPIEGDLRLRARYCVGRAVILRWRAETDLYCGTPRGPIQRRASRSTLTRQKPYKRIAMHEKVSWYDGDDDLAGLIDAPLSRADW